FAVGGSVGKGQFLLLADHSVFINEMMLQEDNGNFDLALRTLDWLRGDKTSPRTKILYWEENRVITDFYVPLKAAEIPPVTPPLPKLKTRVEAVEESVGRMEESGDLDKLLGNVTRSVFGSDKDPTGAEAARAVYALVLALCFVGLRLAAIIRARRR